MFPPHRIRRPRLVPRFAQGLREVRPLAHRDVGGLLRVTQFRFQRDALAHPVLARARVGRRPRLRGEPLLAPAPRGLALVLGLLARLALARRRELRLQRARPRRRRVVARVLGLARGGRGGPARLPGRRRRRARFRARRLSREGRPGRREFYIFDTELGLCLFPRDDGLGDIVARRRCPRRLRLGRPGPEVVGGARRRGLRPGGREELRRRRALWRRGFRELGRLLGEGRGRLGERAAVALSPLLKRFFRVEARPRAASRRRREAIASLLLK